MAARGGCGTVMVPYREYRRPWRRRLHGGESTARSYRGNEGHDKPSVVRTLWDGKARWRKDDGGAATPKPVMTWGGDGSNVVDMPIEYQEKNRNTNNTRFFVEI